MVISVWSPQVANVLSIKSQFTIITYENTHLPNNLLLFSVASLFIIISYTKLSSVLIHATLKNTPAVTCHVQEWYVLKLCFLWSVEDSNDEILTTLIKISHNTAKCVLILLMAKNHNLKRNAFICSIHTLMTINLLENALASMIFWHLLSSYCCLIELPNMCSTGRTPADRSCFLRTGMQHKKRDHHKASEGAPWAVENMRTPNIICGVLNFEMWEPLTRALGCSRNGWRESIHTPKLKSSS